MEILKCQEIWQIQISNLEILESKVFFLVMREKSWNIKIADLIYNLSRFPPEQ